MTHLFTIQDDTVIINKLAVAEVHGNIAIKGNTIAHGSVDITGSLTSRDITTDTLTVKRLISEVTDFGNWHSNTFDDLNGKGLIWSCDEGNTQLIYRTGNRIWTSSNIDLSASSSYKIDDISVLSLSSLGSTVTKSNLRQLGSLTALSVIGTTSLGGFAFFDDNTGRLGLGTSSPNSSISILDNNVEISIGSPTYNLATIGTYSNHNVAFISDNTARMTITHSGEVHISDQVSKSGILRVFGSIYADSIVTDTRIDRSSSIEFNSSRNNDIYDKGLVWNTSNVSKKLVLADNPSRIWSSESFDIAKDHSYYINGNAVISEDSLGSNVLNSSLINVGKLTNLTVDGDTVLHGSVTLTNTLNVESVETSNIIALDSILITASDTNIITANSTEIVIGSNQQSTRPVKVFGPLAIGINTPDPTVSLSVNGTVSFNNKKFITGLSIPNTGVFAKGDICWNENPTENGYVGWVCIQSGTPGEWRPFGLIGT